MKKNIKYEVEKQLLKKLKDMSTPWINGVTIILNWSSIYLLSPFTFYEFALTVCTYAVKHNYHASVFNRNLYNQSAL